MPSPERREFENLTEPQIKKVLSSMRSALKRMRGIVRDKKGSDFDLFAARQKVHAITREIDALEGALIDRLGDATKAATTIADTINADAPNNPVGVDASIAARAQADAAKMVRNVTDRMRRDLNAATVQGVTGEIDRAEFEQKIADVIDADVMSHRVDRIARTELGGLFEGQGAEADARLAEQGADLIKVWLHKCGGRQCFGARPEHVVMHGQERELWEDFNVGGGATASTPPGGGVGERAARPLAPGLTAGERINCGCSVARRPRSEAKQPYTAKVNPRAKAAPASR